MPKPFKPTRPFPLPADADILEHEGRPHVRLKDRGRTVLYPLTKDGTKYLRPAKRWYFDLRDDSGTVRRVRGFADLKATERLAADMDRKASRVRSGYADPAEEHARRPLADHLKDYAAHLAAKGNCEQHNRATVAKVSAILSGCGFVFPPDLDAGKVSAWLTDLRRPGRVPDLPPGDAFTPSGAAELLGMTAVAVRRFVARHRLPTVGAGRARRLPRATVRAIWERKAKGAGPATVNRYTVAVRGFTRWLVRLRRIGSDPLESLPLVNAAVDVRRARRELTADELRALLAGARASGRTFRGLAGEDRFMLYLVAAGTGFRANALANLTPADFDLDAAAPVVTLAARFAKNRRPKVQPLPADVADALRGYLTGKPAGAPVWGGTWASGCAGAEMIRRDLEAVGIPYAADGPDGPEYADFHALRHTYLTMLGRVGVDLRTAQELAGHSTPLLTARYSHRRLYDLAGAVGKLPALVPTPGPDAGRAEVPLRRTGTEGPNGAAPGAVPDAVPGAVTGGIGPRRTAPMYTFGIVGGASGRSAQPLEKTGAGASRRRPASNRLQLPGLDSNQDKENQNPDGLAGTAFRISRHFGVSPCNRRGCKAACLTPLWSRRGTNRLGWAAICWAIVGRAGPLPTTHHRQGTLVSSPARSPSWCHLPLRRGVGNHGHAAAPHRRSRIHTACSPPSPTTAASARACSGPTAPWPPAACGQARPRGPGGRRLTCRVVGSRGSRRSSSGCRNSSCHHCPS
jgi:excisionase family DNA binding protein